MAETTVKTWDLTTLAAVKDWLNSNGLNAEDDILQRLISAMSSSIHSHLSRTRLKLGPIVGEKINGTGNRVIYPVNYPIVSIESLSVSGTVWIESTSPSVQGYAINGNKIEAINNLFPLGRGNVVLSYTAGYAEGSMELYELEQALIEWLAVRFRERAHIGEVSKNLQGMVVTYTQRDIPGSVKLMLESEIRRTG